MQHLNCFVLEAIARELRSKLPGETLCDCFSNSIDELVLEFDTLSWRCIFHQGSVFFDFQTGPIGRNRLFKPQFREITGAKISDVIAHPFERSFHIETENGFKLYIKAHGRKSNIILFEADAFLDMFRLQLEKDTELKATDMYRHIIPAFNAEALTSRGAFEQHYPYLPKEFYNHLGKDAVESDFLALIYQYQNLSRLEYDDHFELHPGHGPGSVLEDTSQFTRAYLRHSVFTNTRSSLLAQTLHAIREKQNFITANRRALQDLKTKRSDEEFGNIILSNLHLIKPGDKLARLHDVYNDTEIDIKLDERLNGVENAERYFRKEKGRPHALRLLEQKISAAEKALIGLEQKLKQLEDATQYKSLKSLLDRQDQSARETELPFRKFNIDGYEVLVGKHAESNEKILNYYSDKNDIWLHAKDVSGSHVLVKMNRNSTLPERVLEKAASLAAYYSKARNQQLATVAYTQRKYVRKIKGGEKGQVTVSQEKTVLVKPSKSIEN